jgi:glycerophosphoryl diester phosphodiesterase
MFDYQAEDLMIRSRDIQLLRLSKEMQEFLRSGDIHKQAAELSNLEKISEHSQKNHVYQIAEKKTIIEKLKNKQKSKTLENRQLSVKLKTLKDEVDERYNIQKTKGIDPLMIDQREPMQSARDTHRELYTRRRLVDLAKTQAQDIAILREELERLRLRTYPAFRGTRKVK